MKIFLGADHRGFELKEVIKPWLIKQGYEVIDLGNDHYEPEDDYPDFTFPVAEQVAAETESRGIVVCGSGIGVTMAANKVVGIRAGAAHSVSEAEHARAHDNINVLALAADYLDEATAQQLIEAFLGVEFRQEKKYIRRVGKITAYETLS